MISVRIEGTTRVCGKSQGYSGLAIRDEKSDGFNIMSSAWEPTPAEIENIVKGGKVIVSVIGNNPQPIKLYVQNMT